MGKWIGLTVLLVLGILGVGMYRAQKIPFFVNKGLSMGGTNLKLYTFQPIYLWSYEKQGGVFVKTLYLGKWNLPRLADLWIAGEYKDEKLDPAPYAKDGKKAGELGDVDAIRQIYKFGNRMRAEYVTGETVPGLTGPTDNTFCLQSPRICQLQNIVQENVVRVPFRLPLPVLALVDHLEL